MCDKSSGTCLCAPKVGGSTCSQCDHGYTNFPYCNQCAAGFSGFPVCQQCDCDTQGVTAMICNAYTARCDCRTTVGGARCDTCRLHYKEFPACVPDVRDGTLGEWAAWSAWVAQGTCGESSKTGYSELRKRRRTCDDSTKNIHGRSCSGNQLEQIETIFREVSSLYTII